MASTTESRSVRSFTRPRLVVRDRPDLARAYGCAHGSAFLRLLLQHAEALSAETVRSAQGADPARPTVDGLVLREGQSNGAAAGTEGEGGSLPEPISDAAHGHERLAGVAAETELRLGSDPIRHDFLTRIYAFAGLRNLGPEPSVAALGDFQRRHKHLLMTYDQPAMRALGSIASDSTRDAHERYAAYAREFRRALGRMPSRGAYVNALMHMYGHFKTRLSPRESETFLAQLESFGEGEFALHRVTDVIAYWCLRFEYTYLADQSLLAPYPRTLVRTPESPHGASF